MIFCVILCDYNKLEGVQMVALQLPCPVGCFFILETDNPSRRAWVSKAQHVLLFIS